MAYASQTITLAAAYPLIWAILLPLLLVSPPFQTQVQGPLLSMVALLSPSPVPYWTELNSLPQHLHSTLNQGSAEELFAYHLYPGPSPLSESPLDLRRKVVVTVPLLRPTRQTPARHKPSSANLLPISWITNAGSSRPATGSVLCIPTAGTGRHISTGGPKAQHTEKGPLFPHNQSQSM